MLSRNTARQPHRSWFLTAVLSVERGRGRPGRLWLRSHVGFQAQPLEHGAHCGLVRVPYDTVGDLLCQFQQRRRDLRCVPSFPVCHLPLPAITAVVGNVTVRST